MSNEIKTQVVVLGAGPAGYSAAFRAADLGLDTVIVERFSTLGGVCLNVGCIPSKALLHVSKVIEEAKAVADHGVVFGEPKIDLDKLRGFKEKVIGQLTGGLGGMSKMRKVDVVNGLGKFTGPNTLEVQGEDGVKVVHFEHAIIAAGSRPIQLPFIPHEDPRIWDSTDALELKEVPGKLLVMGGGIIGLEMGTVYSSLGSEIDVVEMFDQVIPAADKDVVRTFTKQIKKKFNLILQTKVTAVEAKEDGIYVTMEGKKAPSEPVRYDAVLVAIGRTPNGKGLDAEKAGVNVDERGFINVDKQMRTNVPNIFAIGDIVGQPMLAHKGVHEGHVAAEVISGLKHFFDPKVIPSIAYTDPEVAWVGLTEKEAKEQGVSYETATFPWAASGRAIASDASEGMTKLIFDKETHRVIGGAIVGVNGGELLGEIGLAIEMGCDAEDLALTIHAHPTLHESVGLAAAFTSNELVIFTEKLGKHLDCFCERIGYGVSRGGFATSMFSKNLRLDRALLLMPISTYDISIASWDPKVREAAQHLNASPDSADCDIPLTIIYDPLYKPDSMHMKRFQSCRVRFPLPGVGHRIPRALLQLGILKSTILQYRQQQIDPASFFLKIRKRRTLSFFYRGLQSCNNTSRFSLRSRVILFHRIQYHINHLDIDPKKIYQQLSESIQKRCFYTTERIFGHGYKNVAGLSALVLC